MNYSLHSLGLGVDLPLGIEDGVEHRYDIPPSPEWFGLRLRRL